MAKKLPKYDLKRGYDLRCLAALAASLLLANLTVMLWPKSDAPFGAGPVYRPNAQETIRIDDILPTRQALKKPPPPPPLVPIVVPNDDPVEDYDLDIPERVDTEDGEAQHTELTSADSGQAPSIEARPVRIVEPEYTRSARSKKVRAEVVVEVLVDERGSVQEVKVVERYLLGQEDEPRRRVSEIGFGLEESALLAAEKWVFRPARARGKAVPSYTTVTFTFGV